MSIALGQRAGSTAPALRRAVVAAVASLGLAVMPACRSASEAEHHAVCAGLRRGTSRAVVTARFRALGATAAFVGECWFFQRREWRFRHDDVCEACFDRHDRLLSAYPR